jgi:hypothetical protein
MREGRTCKKALTISPDVIRLLENQEVVSMPRNPGGKVPFELVRLINTIDRIEKYLKTPTEEEKQRYAERDVLLEEFREDQDVPKKKEPVQGKQKEASQ